MNACAAHQARYSVSHIRSTMVGVLLFFTSGNISSPETSGLKRAVLGEVSLKFQNKWKAETQQTDE